MRKRWFAPLATVVACGIMLGTGAAVAAAAASSSQVIHGCVRLSGRAIVDVYTAKTPKCPSGTFAIHWGVQGPAGPAGPAGPSGSNGQDADVIESSVIQVTGHDDSGVGGNWAKDSFARTMTVIRHDAVDASHCGGAAHCWFFTGSISDAGSFTSVDGAKDPNTGASTINGIVTGSFNGGASFQFYADSGDLRPSSLSTVDGGPGSSDPSWPASFLPGSAHVSGYDLLGSWGWTYNAPATCETWVNSAAGNLGNITGVNACTS